MARRILVPVVLDRNACENVDDQCDDTEDGGEGHKSVHKFAEINTKRSDVGCVTEDAEVEEEDRELSRPDGEFVHYLSPPEPLFMLAIRSFIVRERHTMRALASCLSDRVDTRAP